MLVLDLVSVTMSGFLSWLCLLHVKVHDIVPSNLHIMFTFRRVSCVDLPWGLQLDHRTLALGVIAARKVKYLTSNCFIQLICCRAVDNQIFFGMCSPARDLAADYHAVSAYISWFGQFSCTAIVGSQHDCRPNVSLDGFSHSAVLNQTGPRFLVKPGKVKRSYTRKSVILLVFICQALLISLSIDPKVFQDARAGIPVTTQRRFDVYSDVSKV